MAGSGRDAPAGPNLREQATWTESTLGFVQALFPGGTGHHPFGRAELTGEPQGLDRLSALVQTEQLEATRTQHVGVGPPPGIDQVLRTSYVKGGRLVFKPDQWEQNQLRELKRQKKLVRPRDFLTASWQEFNKKPGATHQAALFVRFLLSGPKKQTKRFLEDYMYELIQLIEERSKKDKEAAKKKGAKEQTEEEQAAQYKARRQAEKKRLQAVFDKAFGSWSESKWKKFEQAYRSFAG